MKRRKVDVQIRGVPVELRDRLRERASRKGVSMSRYVTELLENELPKLSPDEFMEAVRRLGPSSLPPEVTGAQLVREGRRDMGWEDD